MFGLEICTIKLIPYASDLIVQRVPFLHLRNSDVSLYSLLPNRSGFRRGTNIDVFVYFESWLHLMHLIVWRPLCCFSLKWKLCLNTDFSLGAEGVRNCQAVKFEISFHVLSIFLLMSVEDSSEIPPFCTYAEIQLQIHVLFTHQMLQELSWRNLESVCLYNVCIALWGEQWKLLSEFKWGFKSIQGLNGNAFASQEGNTIFY